MTARDPEQTIRDWFRDGPVRSSGRGLEDTLARLATVRQPARREVRLPLWVPAAALLAVVVGGLLAFGAGYRIVPPTPIASASATPGASPSASGLAGACQLAAPVGGIHGVLVGTGFAPDTDVVIEITRGNGTHIVLDRAYSDAMHTDRRGSFGVALRPHADDLGHETFVARAGCEARLETDVTAADLPEPCPDPADSSTPAVDGPAYRAAVAEDRPAHWWPLDDTGDVAADTATTAGGSGGPGADPGTYVGRAVHAARSALSDGGSTYFDFVFPDPISIDLAHPVEFDADFTFELWAYMCGYIDFEYPVLGMTDDNLRFDWGPGKLRLLDGRFELAMADTTVPTGSWHHWLITRRDGSLQIYFDGVPDGWGTDANWRDPIAVARIGNANPDTGTGFFDEVAIYDYALSPERVAAHANP